MYKKKNINEAQNDKKKRKNWINQTEKNYWLPINFKSLFNAYFPHPPFFFFWSEAYEH